MRLRLLSGFLALFFWNGNANAQAISGIDLNQLPAPLLPSAFAALEPAQGMGSAFLAWSLRFTSLTRPLALRFPSPDPKGTDAVLVDQVFLSEFSAAVALPAGWDVGFGLGAHLYQSGQGNAAAVSEGNSIRPFGGRDPRVAVGWTSGRESLHVRPYLEVTLPLGNPDALAGERSPRGELGAALSLGSDVLEWSSELSFLLRERVELSSTSWGHQVHFGTGVCVLITDHLQAATEIHLSPVLAKQSSRGSVAGGFLLPAEWITSVGYDFGGVTLRGGGGLGLPLSTTSSLHSKGRLVRAPTTPLLRTFLAVSVEN